MEQLDYLSDNFALYSLGPGVYAAIADPDGGAYCNAGIIDLGDRTLIVDAFETIAAAEDLKAAAQTLTGRPASAVIITHEHGDHWYGNQVFSSPTAMISAASAREAMRIWNVEEVEVFRRSPSEFLPMIREFQANADSAEDEEMRVIWERRVLRMQRGMLQAPELYPRLPDQTFDVELTFLGLDRSVVVHNFGHAHSRGDVCVFVPDAEVAFIGDLGFFDRHPYLLNSVPKTWVDVLQTLAGMHYETFIPGHGPIGGRAEVQELQSYIETLMDLTTEAKRAGKTLEEIVALPFPEKLHYGPGSEDAIGESIRFLFETMLIEDGFPR